jgi:Protein of unknown function DUF262/Protein of unknown function (DUF1524)
MTTKIEAHEQNIGDVFSDAYEFEIPPYQRPYAWEGEQAQELLMDLLDAMDNQDLNGGLYFLGSIVIVKQPSESQSKVIDGQQRLTTLTILLSVIRDLTSDQEIRFGRRAYVYQKPNADRGLKERYRLLLREQDRPFFLKYVQSPGSTDQLPDPSKLEGSQKRIADNARNFRAQLEAMPEERRNALIAFIVQRCYLVVVAVATTDAARRIFTVLNARGLDLTPTDILKAELLERVALPPPQETALAARWEQVERALGRERMVELFGHIRMIYERDKPRLSLESGFKKVVLPFSEGAESFVSDILEPASDAFLLLSDATRIQKHFGAEAARAVRSLGRIDSKDWIPPVLLRIWKCQPTDQTGVAKFIIDLERVAYFLFVTRAGVNERIARFAAIMDELEPRAGREPDEVGISLAEPEQYAFLRVLTGALYPITRVCKPVLQRLDEALSSGGASYDELVSIEHVLPQTVDESSEWAMMFPTEEMRNEWTHRLANLVFLTHRINTRASNWSFERKKKEYFSSSDGSSPFVITQGVLQTDQWTPEHLQARQRQLLLKLCQVWRLNDIYIDEQADLTKQKGTWQFTDGAVLDAKRDQMMQALSRRENVQLTRKGALCRDESGDFRAVVTVSKRHPRRSAPYWYRYADGWLEFLSQGPKSQLVFGSVDRDSAYAVPAIEMDKIVAELNRTPDSHWHVVLNDNDQGGLDLVLPTGARVSLKKFQLNLD